MKKIVLVALFLTGFLYAIPRRGAQKDQVSRASGIFTLRSSAFRNRGRIPERYTCDGKDISPQLNWAHAPAGTQSFALVFHDPDALGGPWNHWVVANIPGHISEIDEQIDMSSIGAIVGTNSWEDQRYSGPCPPLKEHRYIFTLYALDIPKLPVTGEAHRKDLIAAMKGHVLGQAQFLGKYQRVMAREK